MNKRIALLPYILLLMIAVPLTSFGQKGKHKLANTYFLQYDMKKAAEIYEDIIAKDSTDAIALRRAAECRMNVEDAVSAEAHLAKLVLLEDMQSTDYLTYAEALKQNGKYTEAVEAYKRYTELRPDDPRVYYYFEQDDWLHRILRDSSRYELFNSQVNSSFSDFGVTFVGEQVYFSSSRGEGKGSRNIYAWNDQSYLNFYEADVAEDSTLGAPRVMSNKANSRYHEGTMAWDSTANRIYITRNFWNKGKRKRSKVGRLNLAIFSTDLADADFKKLEPFVHNSSEYSVGHPTISKDGQTMYFVSNMPGGMGGTDIYKCKLEGDQWGKPENLAGVNTGGNEMFPFLQDSSLYFSSDGHPGLGGLDLFFVDLGKPEMQVINLGYPLSTKYDDFNVCLFNNGERGFFSSNRPMGMGDDDIWEFQIKPVNSVIISGKVLDLISQLPIEGAEITVKDESGLPISVAESDKNGRFSFETDRMDSYSVSAIKDGYAPKEIAVQDLEFTRFIDDADIALQPTDFGVEGTVLYAENEMPAEGAKLTLIDQSGNIVAETTTGPDGAYYFPLEPQNNYTLECVMFGYPDQEIKLDTRDKPAEIFKSDFRLFKMEEGVTVRLDNIYYDYDKYDIRSDAAIELNKLVSIMNDNQTMKIELGSHTDSRGSKPYNQELSRKRAEAVVKYLSDKGINTSRLKSKGYGESKLMNKCRDGVECTEEEHQLNRRTEFTILKI